MRRGVKGWMTMMTVWAEFVSRLDAAGLLPPECFELWWGSRIVYFVQA